VISTVQLNGQAASATIDWGNGQVSAGTLVPTTNGASQVMGTNTFFRPGTFPVTVSITTANGSHTTIHSTVHVNESPNGHFLDTIYHDFFQRPVDPTGWNAWMNMLDRGASRVQVVQAIEGSLEYCTKVVDELYAQLLGRAPDPQGLNAFVSFLGQGGTAEAVEAEILLSPEYWMRQGGTNTGFLSGIYRQILGRSVDPTGQAVWGTALQQGAPREAVVLGVLTSLEANQDFIEQQYQTWLHRPADVLGLAAYLSALEHGSSAEQILALILGSGEYFSRATGDKS
jgi:hypothetical protein